MGNPPPKLIDLKSITKTAEFVKSEDFNVWEIGVPPTTSLYWSIILPYILSSDNDRLSKFLDCIKSDSTGKSKKKISCNVNSFKELENEVKNCNPFMNRHVFFFRMKIISVMRAFKLKLNQYANNRKSKDEKEPWGDDWKLSAAADMLNCNIEVYFPDEGEKKYFSHQKKNSKEELPSIVLFQYKDQKHGARERNINIFRFAMTTDQAYFRKLHALTHILKKTQLSSDVVAYIGRLMLDEKAHGNNFLPTILQSAQFSTIPHLYKSPYIAVKLSQAGFETNPTASDPERPSALLYAMSKIETKYIRILYDYAVNCRYLFDKTIRHADESVLNNLESLRDIFLKDVSNFHFCKFRKVDEERTLTIQNEYFRFLEYQQNVATNIMKLKSKLDKKKSGEEKLCIRKNVVKCILESYVDFFYFNSPQTGIINRYCNYLQFSEYYENIDNFSCLSFFDNIHLLKKIFQIIDEDIYWAIESHFFLLIISNQIFPKFEHDVLCHPDHSKTKCEMDKNILRLIPLLHRENHEQEITSFLSKLDLQNITPQNEIDEEKLRSSLFLFPEIKDELLISRIKTYLKAAMEVSLPRDGYKGILVIERALQVIGESLKPQTTKGCVVSCLMGSQIPFDLKTRLIDIRDNLSHYLEKKSEGRLHEEENYDLFINLQNELKEIAKYFEIVAFTQYLGLEKYLLEKGKNEILKGQFDPFTVKNFLQEYQKRLDKQEEKCTEYRNQCIRLSLAISNLFLECVKEKKKRDVKQETQQLERDTKKEMQQKERNTQKETKQKEQDTRKQTQQKKSSTQQETQQKEQDTQKETQQKKRNTQQETQQKEQGTKKETRRKERDTTKNSGENYLKSKVSPILKSMEFIFMFMGKYINGSYFQPFLEQIKLFSANYESKLNIDILNSDIFDFYTTYKATVMETYKIHDNLQTEFPALESFLKCCKQSDISTSDIDLIIQAVNDSYDEAIEAKDKLTMSIQAKSFNQAGGEDMLLQKLIISQESFKKLKTYFTTNSKELKPALVQLKKRWISKDDLKEKVRELFQKNSTDDDFVKMLLLKIANQRNLQNKIYTSVTLPTDICVKLEKILTRKTQFLLTRVRQIKSVLIDEDEDIKDAWDWGKSKEMKYHMKFLMLQRFLREMPVRASLELAFLDCLNILKNKQYCDIYEKVNNLFTGIDLRNVLSHGHSVLETIGGLLDEDDLPSEMINKMLEIIEDSEVIVEMQKLIPISQTLYEEDFKRFIRENKEEDIKMKFEKKYKRWESYTFLLPLILNDPPEPKF